MGGRGPKHTFDTYPEVLQDAIDNRIRKGETYENIVDWINNMDEVKDGHMKGTSVSGVSRYASKFKDRLEKSIRIREQVKAVMDEAKDHPDTDMVEAANKIAIEMVVERLMTADMSELQEQSILKVIDSVTKLQRSAVGNEKLKIQFKKYKNDLEDKKKVALDTFKKSLYEELESDHPEIYQKLVKIADETMQKIRLEDNN
jgi:hypothetical protein